MVKITHINGDEKFVTKGAFESIFKPLGYKLVVNKEIQEEENIQEIEEDLTGNEETLNNEKESENEEESETEETEEDNDFPRDDLKSEQKTKRK